MQADIHALTHLRRLCWVFGRLHLFLAGVRGAGVHTCRASSGQGVRSAIQSVSAKREPLCPSVYFVVVSVLLSSFVRVVVFFFYRHGKSVVQSILPPSGRAVVGGLGNAAVEPAQTQPNHGAPPLGHAVHGVHCAERDPQPDALAQASVLTLTLALTLTLT